MRHAHTTNTGDVPRKVTRFGFVDPRAPLYHTDTNEHHYNMSAMEQVDAGQEIDEVEDDMMGPLPISKMEVRWVACVHTRTGRSADAYI